MSLARVQFFSISLDGFGTGEGQSTTADADVQAAGMVDRLHFLAPGDGSGGIEEYCFCFISQP